MNRPYQIRPFRAEDLPHIARGFADAFHVYRSAGDWQRRFRDEPACGMVALAEGSEEPLAFYGATLHRAEWRGRSLQVGQIVDTYSHPEARQDHPHVFARTADAFFDHFCGPEPERIQVLYGFPSRGPARLGERYLSYLRLAEPRWSVCDLTQYQRDAAAVSYAGRVELLADLSCVGDRIRPASDDWLQFDMSAEAMARRFPLVGKDATYLAFGLKQTAGDSLLALAVCRVEGDAAWLMSLHAALPALAVGLWARVLPALTARGAKRAWMMTGPAHYLHPLLPDMGFVGAEARLSLVPTYRVFDTSLDTAALADRFCYDLFHLDVV